MPSFLPRARFRYLPEGLEPAWVDASATGDACCSSRCGPLAMARASRPTDAGIVPRLPREAAARCR